MAMYIARSQPAQPAFQADRLPTTIDEFSAALGSTSADNETRIKILLGDLSPATHRRSLGIAADPVQVFGRTPMQPVENQDNCPSAR